MRQPHTKLLHAISTIITSLWGERKQVLNTEYWIYIYTNLLPFLLQLDWTVFFFILQALSLATRSVGKSQGRQRSLRRLLSASMSTSVTSFTFTVDQLFPIQSNTTITVCLFFRNWNTHCNTELGRWPIVHLFPIYGYNLIEFTPPPCAIQVCADRKFDNQVQ